jgi:hypothetical protein
MFYFHFAWWRKHDACPYRNKEFLILLLSINHSSEHVGIYESSLMSSYWTLLAVLCEGKTWINHGSIFRSIYTGNASQVIYVREVAFVLVTSCWDVKLKCKLVAIVAYSDPFPDAIDWIWYSVVCMERGLKYMASVGNICGCWPSCLCFLQVLAISPCRGGSAEIFNWH